MVRGMSGVAFLMLRSRSKERVNFTKLCQTLGWVLPTLKCFEDKIWVEELLQEKGLR